jgi:hypothetical protein
MWQKSSHAAKKRVDCGTDQQQTGRMDRLPHPGYPSYPRSTRIAGIRMNPPFTSRPASTPHAATAQPLERSGLRCLDTAFPSAPPPPSADHARRTPTGLRSEFMCVLPQTPTGSKEQSPGLGEALPWVRSRKYVFHPERVEERLALSTPQRGAPKSAQTTALSPRGRPRRGGEGIGHVLVTDPAGGAPGIVEGGDGCQKRLPSLCHCPAR